MIKPNLTARKKIIAINSLIIAALFGLVSLNKEILRPALNSKPIADIITGCFPNFVAAYLLCLALVNAVLIKKPKHGKLFAYTGSIIIFIILTIEELKPMWGASTHYDSYDIIASGVGSFLAILTYELIRLSRLYRIKKN